MVFLDQINEPMSTRFSGNNDNDLQSPFVSHLSDESSKYKSFHGLGIKASKVRTAGNSPAMSPGRNNATNS